MGKKWTKQTPCQRSCFAVMAVIFSGLFLGVGIPAIAYKISLAVYQAVDDAQERPVSVAVHPQLPPATSRRRSRLQIAKRLEPALVRITAEHDDVSPEQIEANAAGQRSHLGSGVVIHPDGYILTNHQVVAGARYVYASLSTGDSSSRKAQIVGTDAATDLALLKIDPRGLKLQCAPLGDPRQVRPGSEVFAVAKIFGTAAPINFGCVCQSGHDSASGCLDAKGFIQTDVVIPTEARGGLLVNKQGHIVGILSVADCTAGRAACRGIPADVAANAARLLLEHGRIPRGWLGLVVHNLEIDELLERGLDSPAVEIDYVFPDSPADQAQLCAGDVIRTAGGHPVKCLANLRQRIAQAAFDSTLELHMTRDKQPIQTTVVVGARNKPMPRLPGEEEIGIRIKHLTRERAARLGYSSDAGVLIISADRNRHKGALRSGHIITALNQMPTPNLATFCRVVEEVGATEHYTLTIRVYEGGTARMRIVDVAQTASKNH